MATCRAWMDAAGGMSVTFHRAFDLARDPERTMEDVVELGCERLLTSGQATDALAGAALIRRLTDQSLGRIKIMAGGGITAQNIAAVAAATGAREFHASARLRADARLRQAHPAPPGLEAGHWQTDAGEVRACIDALRALA